MHEPHILRAIQRYVANVGISGSSLRNQGAPGVVNAARGFLATIRLDALGSQAAADYPAWLDRTTGDLLRSMPDNARKWGAARKAVNIFMTHALLNGVLSQEFALMRFAAVMETPLDSVAAQELRRAARGQRLPVWPGVGALTPAVSLTFQAVASEVAKAHGVPRGMVDVFLWRPLPEPAPIYPLGADGSS